MNSDFIIAHAINPALAMLPGMDSPTARVIMLAIAFQESGLQHRRQRRGPARGYWQFEHGGGVRGVLNHSSSRPHIRSVLEQLDYKATSNPATCYAAIEHNDILAAAFARLLMWTDPQPLPTDESGSWDLYMRTWRPGKPHISAWASNYQKALEAIK